MGGRHRVRWAAFALLVCLLGCGHAGPVEDGVPLLRAKGLVSLPSAHLGGDYRPPEDINPGDPLVLAHNARVHFAVTGAGGTVWSDAALDQPDDPRHAELMKLLEAAAQVGALTLAADARQPWKRVTDLLEHVVPAIDGGARLLLAVTPDGDRSHLGWLDLEVVRSARRDPARALGLTLRIQGPRDSARIVIEPVGDTWPLLRGCDASHDQTVPGWGEPAQRAWREALDELKRLGQENTLHIQVTVGDGLRVEEVVPFLLAASASGIQRLALGLSRGRSFHDAFDDNLEWLGRHERPRRGGWHAEASLTVCDGHLVGHGGPAGMEPRGQTGLTGMSLLAFLGAGYTHRGKHRFAKTISRALRLLKDRQAPQGHFEAQGSARPLRSTAWASFAMVEAYGMTGSPIFKGSAQRAINHIGLTVDTALKDPPAAAICYAVLKSASLINKDAAKRGKSPPLVVADGSLRRLVQGAAAIDLGRTDVEASAALYIRFVEGAAKEERAELGAALGRQINAWDGPSRTALPPGQAWLLSVAAFCAGGSSWKRWRRVLQKRPDERVRSDGSFRCFRGTVDPSPTPVFEGGRVAATALQAQMSTLFWTCRFR